VTFKAQGFKSRGRMSWCTIESDPGVFTELISTIGVRGVQMEELYGLEAIDKLTHAYGLIFLFKWQKEANKDQVLEAEVVFFSRQKIPNACATQAILNVLMNRPEIDLGEHLSNFKEFVRDLPPQIIGETIGNSEPIRIAHNSFARPEPFILDSKEATEDDDVYHFIGYVPVNGALYELDGLQPGPILLGECDMNNWLQAARPAIQERIERYSSKEIRFNLLALVRNRADAARERIAAIETAQSLVRTRIGGVEQEEPNDDNVATIASLRKQLHALDVEHSQLQEVVLREKQRFEDWAIENVRRKHNYVPFVFGLLKILAKEGKLAGLREEGKKQSAARTQAAQKRNAK